MNIILFLLIIILSSILSLFSSGIEHLIFNSKLDPNYHAFSLGYYFIGFFFGIYLFYKFKFKTPSVFKFFLLRQMLNLNSMFHKIDDKVYSERIELTPLQEKSIQIWNSLLKDKSTILSSNILTYDRTIQRGSLFAVFKTNLDNTLTIIDNESMNLYCEVHVPQLYKNEMVDFFDKELDKRMRNIELRKRNHIESILSKVF